MSELLTVITLTGITYLSFLWGWVIPVVSPQVACASAIAQTRPRR